MILIPKKIMTEHDPISMLPLYDRYARGFFREHESGDRSRTLPMDIIENDKDYLILANLPGFEKKDVTISTRKDHLIIEAKPDNQPVDDKTKVHYSERFNGSYARAVHLPETIDRENIKASMNDGVLMITIPKNVQPNKEIVVE